MRRFATLLTTFALTMSGLVVSPAQANGTTITNGDFETDLVGATPITGWTSLNQRIDLGVDEIAGCATQDTSDYTQLQDWETKYAESPVRPPYDNQTANNDSSVSSTDVFLSSYQSSIANGIDAATTTNVLKLESVMEASPFGYVIHGPAIYSDPFYATVAKNFSVRWSAQIGFETDDYHVFGYLLNVDTCAQTEVIDATGASSNWTQAQVAIPSNGNYRFVFVSGTYDWSWGGAAGAIIYLDDAELTYRDYWSGNVSNTYSYFEGIDLSSSQVNEAGTTNTGDALDGFGRIWGETSDGVFTQIVPVQEEGVYLVRDNTINDDPENYDRIIEYVAPGVASFAENNAPVDVLVKRTFKGNTISWDIFVYLAGTQTPAELNLVIEGNIGSDGGTDWSVVNGFIVSTDGFLYGDPAIIWGAQNSAVFASRNFNDEQNEPRLPIPSDDVLVDTNDNVTVYLGIQEVAYLDITLAGACEPSLGAARLEEITLGYSDTQYWQKDIADVGDCWPIVPPNPPAPAPAAPAGPAPAIETPAQVVDTGLAARTVSAKKKYSGKSLAKQVGVTIISKKATVSFKIAKSSKKVCTKSGAKLRTLKAGNCVVTFTVQEPKPKKGKKPKATKTTTTLVVQ